MSVNDREAKEELALGQVALLLERRMVVGEDALDRVEYSYEFNDHNVTTFPVQSSTHMQIEMDCDRYHASLSFP